MNLRKYVKNRKSFILIISLLTIGILWIGYFVSDIKGRTPAHASRKPLNAIFQSIKNWFHEEVPFPEFTSTLQEIDSAGKVFFMDPPHLYGGDARVHNNAESYDPDPVRVNFTYSFEIMRTEVTQEIWVLVMNSNPSIFKEKKYCENDFKKYPVAMCPYNPVENISWKDIDKFIKKLHDKMGLSFCNDVPYPTRVRDKAKDFHRTTGCFRLPTDAEWEFAARGGTITAYYFGDSADLLDDYAWYERNSFVQTWPVKQKLSNDYGLYDMHGNVSEWVLDEWMWEKRRGRIITKLPGGENPLYINPIIKFRLGFKHAPDRRRFRIVRGGSFTSKAKNLRFVSRIMVDKRKSKFYVGFRLARTL
ncbi:MAG: formylglycine-generating enzyme family protein [Halobacteriovoraceae bacterium]|nr:formylglycine-generating enzyme family protein [Halobacteriovoraceae bacterium]